mmetsp:Transcript_35695/g.36170  ORF Transcript_35695/g.36170 Transcript_35695/m.36170 type:complete len:106 (+) Transcript_35695:868-1185(+)
MLMLVMEWVLSTASSSLSSSSSSSSSVSTASTAVAAIFFCSDSNLLRTTTHSSRRSRGSIISSTYVAVTCVIKSDIKINVLIYFISSLLVSTAVFAILVCIWKVM